MHAVIELFGIRVPPAFLSLRVLSPITALNGGPVFRFDEAISFSVNCRTQREIDYHWKKLSSGGSKTGPCG